MSKPAYKEQIACDEILKILEENYTKRYSKRLKKELVKIFKTKSSIIDAFFENKRFVEPGYDVEVEVGQLEISRNTVNNAITLLINDGRVHKNEDGIYEVTPKQYYKFRDHPILNIAGQVGITIGIPENYIFLTVAKGAVGSVIDYLSSVFYQGDILFIPIGNIIMCVEVLPEALVNTNKPYEKHDSSWLKSRIEAALRLFDVNYPRFMYNHAYEMPVIARLDPYFREELKQMAQLSMEENIDNYILGMTRQSVFNRMCDTLETINEINERILQQREEVDAFFGPMIDDELIDESEDD